MATTSPIHSVSRVIVSDVMPGLIMPVCLCLGGCAPPSSTGSEPAAAVPPGLSVEEHELKPGPELDPLTFVPVYSAALGDACVVPPLWGLWAYEGHWVLEAAHVKAHRQGDSVTCDAVGEIVRDGQSLNAQYGYQESFGFQLMDEKPFYFFKKGGEFGMSYDRHEIPLGYNHISHYACCSGAVANLRSSQTMVAFFAGRDGTTYYVEIGLFG